jgi:cytochrome c oxidase cbb3-type subunit I/II
MTETSADTTPGNLVDTQLVYAHGLAAMVTLLIAVLFGIIVSLQFLFPDMTGNWLSLGWGRLRYAHTQGIMLGWLGNIFFAFLYHAVPVLTGRQITSRRLGRWIFGVWNFVVMAPGWILVLSGISQPIEWAEFPLIIDVFAIAGLVLAGIQFIPPFFRRGLEDLYVSSWYIIGGLVFTALAYPMGNIVPELVPGAASAAFGGLWIHDAVGLFVTPLALAILYYVIPATTGRPIYSHFLSMLGFWGLFFLYPLNGIHHYIFSVIPMAAQLSAIIASALLGVIVLFVVTNLFMSLRGAGLFPRDIALRFASMSIVFYLVVSVQGAMQAQMGLNQTIHFTDWVVAHSHLAMLGFATFAGIGGVIHAWQRIPWARYNAQALEWSYWLLFAGISLMMVDLTIAGVIEGRLWQAEVPWLESVQAAKPYWIVRVLSGIPITAGFILLLLGLTTGPEGAGAQAMGDNSVRHTPEEVLPRLSPIAAAAAETAPSGQVLRMSYIVAAIAGVGFFAGSITLLGIWPERILSQQISATAPANALFATASEERGRDIYAREGCAYCHTQQIRYLEADIARFGAPSLAWESRFEFPHLMGTRRIGPDLSREGGARTADWQYLHLFSPRSVVPLSIMPPYAAFFDGAPDRPKQEARDLVAYLESLGRARELAWPEGDELARAALAGDSWAQMSFDAPVLNAHPARAQARGSAPALGQTTAAENGRQLWRDNCASCHGDQGQGDGPAAPWLSPQPTNLAEHEYSTALLGDVLWNGVVGTAMPAWRDHSPEDLAALAEVARGFFTASPGAEPSVAELALGQQVYVDNCAQCHGDNGDGEGFAASELPIAPNDFSGQRPSIDAALRALTNGVKGTSMAPWTDRLDESELQAVVHYVRQFFQADGGVTGGNQ